MKKRTFHTTFSLFLFIFLLLLPLSCSREASQESKEEVKVGRVIETKNGVLERFETGRNIFTRTLAVQGDILWAGTSQGALKVDMKTGHPLALYDRDDGLSNEYIFAIDMDKEERMWFGTNAGGMSSYDGSKWKTYFPMHGLADYWVYDFTFADDGTMWIATWDGVSRFDGKEFVNYTEKDGLINIWVYGVDIDSKGNVWFATEGGVSMFDGKEWKSWTHKDGLGAPNKEGLSPSDNTGLGTKNREDLSVLAKDTKYNERAGIPARHKISPEGYSYNENYVFTVKVDKNDNVWFGTWGGGVSVFNGNTWKNYTTDDGLAGNIVYAIVTEDGGVMWFGTNNGVSRFDGKTWTNYGVTDGLLNLDVYAIAIDGDNNKWFGQLGGVVKLTDRKL